MAITHISPEAIQPMQPVEAATFPQWLQNLDVEAIDSLRTVAQEYMAHQDAKALEQEKVISEHGVRVKAYEYDDPFTVDSDRQFVDGVVETMIGLRLNLGDAYVYKGNRTKGPDTPLTTAFKELSPAMEYWRDNLVPTSAALSSLYNPDLPILPGVAKGGEGFIPGQPNDAVGRAIFAESLDGRAIRSRGDAVSNIYIEHFTDTNRYPVGSEINIDSLACGAAEVIFSSTAELHRQRPDLKINVHLADIDGQALQRARQYVESHEELDNINFTFNEANILSDADLDKILQTTDGRGFDFIDIVGFLEYLPERTAKRFMSKAYGMVAEGGVLCAANMRDTHRQLEFTANCVRWPHIIPRSLPKLANMTEEACGVSPDDMTMVLPDDGAYAVFSVQK